MSLVELDGEILQGHELNCLSDRQHQMRPNRIKINKESVNESSEPLKRRSFL